MAEVTVKQFAETVGIPVDRLLTQLGAAGVEVSGAQAKLADADKTKLLTHLRAAHGRSDSGATAPRKITLNRKTKTSIKLEGGTGKTVKVEVRKKRTYIKRDADADAGKPVDTAGMTSKEKMAAGEVAEQERLRKAKQLKAEEAAAAKASGDARKRQEEDAKRRAADDARQRRAGGAGAARKPAGKAGGEAGMTQQEKLAKLQAEQNKQPTRRGAAAPKQGDRGGGAGRGGPGGRGGGGRGGAGRRGGGGGRRGRRQEPVVNVDTSHGFAKPTAPVVRDVQIPETMTVGELAQEMAVKATEVIKVMMGMGVMATINQPIDSDTATLVVEEMGHNAVAAEAKTAESKLEAFVGEVEERDLVTRPPVVTIMGHVDHGKTSLLDYIRTSKMTADEAGGITQHIGAYHVETDRGVISFLDTPGHAAFTAMRARGAKVTDIVVLVVAADDSVMPQTEEAIQHAQAAGVPLIVAVNKMDKPEADPERVRSELSAKGVQPDDWGGDTQFMEVSAHTGQGVDELLEAISLQAEVLELTAPADGRASGTVIESSLEKGRGAVASVLVQKGTLSHGDIVLCGGHFGRVRAMLDENAKAIQTAGPSIPVQILGLSGVPLAGDEMHVVDSEKQAREIADDRQHSQRETRLAKQQAAKLEEMMAKMNGDTRADLNVMLKTDVQGSAEALADALTSLSNGEINVKIISRGVGGITESDVNLAAASEALLIAFNVRADASARRLISEMGVDVRYYSIIYEAIDDVKASASGMLAPEVREQFLGYADVRDVFRSSVFGSVAGCLITDGNVQKANPIRVLRDDVVIFEGELESLRRFKDDVEEVKSGTECGIGVKGYNDIKAGDRIECFKRFEVARTL